MDDILKEYFDKYENEQANATQMERDEILIQAGLFTKVWGDTEEYPFFDEQENRHYKKVPIQVTNEEFERIKKLELNRQAEEQKNQQLTSATNLHEAGRSFLNLSSMLFYPLLIISIVAGVIAMIALGNALLGLAIIFVGALIAFFITLTLKAFGALLDGFGAHVKNMEIIAQTLNNTKTK